VRSIIEADLYDTLSDRIVPFENATAINLWVYSALLYFDLRTVDQSETLEWIGAHTSSSSMAVKMGLNT